jgi:hypothetical protein
LKFYKGAFGTQSIVEHKVKVFFVDLTNRMLYKWLFDRSEHFISEKMVLDLMFPKKTISGYIRRLIRSYYNEKIIEKIYQRFR